jgi:hypothetical protein
VLIYNYAEGIVQFGMLVLFAISMPLGPLFSLITNAIEVKVKLNSMSNFSRRRVSQGAQGIGTWLNVMELFAIICIPVNLAILYWVGDVDKGIDQNE